MPLFEIGDEELIPFRQVRGGPELYEEEIEALLWANLESFVGVPLFPVARQPVLSDGLRPDVVALDSDGHVHVIEVKRDVDRRQLAQCLEYAGWARTTNLDELAGMFRNGTEAFFSSWVEFTQTDGPRLTNQPPQLVLVARDFDDRTDAALDFLTDSQLPITVLRVALYQDQDGRKFVDVGSDHEPELAADAIVDTESDDARSAPTHYKIDGRRVTVADLIDGGLLPVDSGLIWNRPRLGVTYRATVLAKGQLQLEDGRTFSSPSRAAVEAAAIPAYDGWHAWCLPDGRSLADLRSELLTRLAVPEQPVLGLTDDAEEEPAATNPGDRE